MTYDEARRLMKDGDILLFDSYSWQHRLITRPLLGFRYSHVAVAVWWNERLFALESVAGKGARTQLLSKSIREYHGRVALHFRRIQLDDSERGKIIVRMQDQLGKDYAKWEALLFGIKLLFGVPLSPRDAASRSTRIFCSWYVADGYSAAERDLIPGLADEDVKPDAIADATQFVDWIAKPAKMSRKSRRSAEIRFPRMNS